jgi:hypothetical protein
VLELILPTLIAIAAMAVFSSISPRFSTGAILSVISVLFGFFQIVGMGLGHCWPSATVACPTDEEIRRAILSIEIIVVLANVLMWLFIAKRRSGLNR